MYSSMTSKVCGGSSMGGGVSSRIGCGGVFSSLICEVFISSSSSSSSSSFSSSSFLLESEKENF